MYQELTSLWCKVVESGFICVKNVKFVVKIGQFVSGLKVALGLDFFADVQKFENFLWKILGPGRPRPARRAQDE
jgi:hypothetical protein